MYLDWMFIHQPDLVRELHRSGGLRQHLEHGYGQTIRRVIRLVVVLEQEVGLTEVEALKVAWQAILPIPAVVSPAVMPGSECEQVLRSLG